MTRPARTPPPLPETDDAEARRQAGRALGSAYRVLKQLRVIYICDAVILAFVLLLALSTDSLLAKAICGALFVAAVAGSIYVVRYPVPSTITLAIVHTPPALLAAGMGFGGAGATRIILMGLGAILWMTVPMALRTRQVVAHYPDLWAARAMRGERREPGRIGRKWRAQAQAHRRQRLVNVLLFGVLPLVVLVTGNHLLGGGGHAGGATGPTERLEPTTARFQAAWNASRHDEVKAFLADSERDRISRLLDKSWWRKGWNETLPQVGTPELTEYDATHWYAHFAIADYGLVKTSWEWEDTAWVLVRITFKKTE